jgi:MFS family permease
VVLGNVGLVQIIPVLLFTFVAGHVADRYNRSRTALITQVGQAAVAFLLAGAGASRGVALIYACLFLTATARAFQWPATSAMLPQTVPPEHLTQAISWRGSAREMATVGGPALAGGLIALWGSEAVYLVLAICCVLSAICFGPGDISLAHAAEEWVTTDEIERATKVLTRFALTWCGGRMGNDGDAWRS